MKDVYIHDQNIKYPNKNLDKKEAINDLSNRSHLEMIRLLGINDEMENEEIIKSLPTYEC